MNIPPVGAVSFAITLPLSALFSPLTPLLLRGVALYTCVVHACTYLPVYESAILVPSLLMASLITDGEIYLLAEGGNRGEARKDFPGALDSEDSQGWYIYEIWKGFAPARKCR